MSGYVEVLNLADITRIWKAIHDAVKLAHAATEVLTPGGGQAYLVIPRFFICALGRSTEAWTYLRSGPGRVDMDTYGITFPPGGLNRSTADATFPRTLSGIPGRLRGLSVAEIGREEAYEAGLRWVPPAGNEDPPPGIVNPLLHPRPPYL
jgi:hypothetical protein